jgi:hypothetical protein
VKCVRKHPLAAYTAVTDNLRRADVFQHARRRLPVAVVHAAWIVPVILGNVKKVSWGTSREAACVLRVFLELQIY